MKITVKILAVFFLCLVMTGVRSMSYGEEWKSFYETEKERFYFDNTSLERLDERSFKIWQKTTEKQASGDEVDKYKSLIEVNCAQKIYRTHVLVEYDTITGRALPEQRYEDNQPWIRFPLESKFGSLYDNFCP